MDGLGGIGLDVNPLLEIGINVISILGEIAFGNCSNQ
jgi:hypothetical protein